MGRPIAMKLAFILFTLLLCAGCGATKSTQTPPPTAASWAGTWSGKVDWVPVGASSSNPSAGDNVTITIAPYPLGTPKSDCEIAGTCTAYQITGTDVGSILGNVNLDGCVLSGHPKPANEGHLKTGQRE